MPSPERVKSRLRMQRVRLFSYLENAGGMCLYMRCWFKFPSNTLVLIMSSANSEKKCPSCQRIISLQNNADPKAFPFCSMRCKLIDLGAWANQEYKIAAEPSDAINDDGEDE